MSVIYTTAVKTDRMTASKDYFINGTLELLSAGDVVLAIFTLTATAGSVATDTWTLAFTSSTVTGEAGAGAGTDSTKAQIKNSGGTASITGLTVGTGGTDIVLDNANIASGQNVTLSSATIQHAA